MPCPSCGAAVPEGARFCPQCGHAVVTRPDERRLVTVVFADLVGFTAISEAADPEQVKHLADRCLARLADDVIDFGGHVDKVLGDALVALFGAPVAHEDDAERAVRAALRMQETIGRSSAELGTDVALRVGVNTGEVLVGGLRAGDDYTAMGDVVNVAQRLQAAAQPGQVVIGPQTRDATAHVLRAEPLGPITVKGRADPVTAWIAREAIAPPGRRVRRPATPLVGRDTELALLDQVVGAATSRSRAQLMVLLGEAGVGKTRIGEEFVRRAVRHHGVHVLVGYCLPYGEPNPWGPLGEAVRWVAGIAPLAPRPVARDAMLTTLQTLAPGRSELDRERLADGLLTVAGFGPEAGGSDPERTRDEAERSLAAFFDALVTTRPVLLFLADLHWGDAALLDGVGRLLATLHARPFVLAATARPELAERWSPPAQHNAFVLHLEPLDVAATRSLVQGLAGGDPDDALVALLHERSGGNPLFIEELVALLGEGSGTGVPALTGDRLRALPATLRGLVTARLDTLPTAHRTLLDEAAVIGPFGPIALLAADDGGADLDGLVAGGFLAVSGGEYTFRSEVVQEVAYGTLAKAERARRHAALAERLDATRADDSTIAHHLTTAAELVAELGPLPDVPDDIRARAVATLTRAAERSGATGAWGQAVGQYTRALGIADHADSAMRRRLLLDRVDSLLAIHDLPAAERDLAEVFAGDGPEPGTRLHAWALQQRGAWNQRAGHLDEARALLDEAIAEWRALGDERSVARALQERARADFFAFELNAAEPLLVEALAIYERLGDRRGEAWAKQHLASNAFFSGRLEEADRRLGEAIETFVELGDGGGLGWARGVLAWVRYNQGRLDDSEALLREVLEQAGGTGNRWADGMMQNLLAYLALWRGRAREARDRAREVVRFFDDLGDAWGALQAHAVLTRALAALGQSDEVREEVTALRGVHLVMGPPQQDLVAAAALLQIGEGPAALAIMRASLDGRPDDSLIADDERRAALGLAVLQCGEPERALADLEAAFSSTRSPGTAAGVGACLALAAAAARRPGDALALADRLLDRPEGTYLDRTWLGIARAAALAQLGDTEGAVDAIDETIAAVDATDALLEQATTRLARSELLAAIGRPDADEARADAQQRLAACGTDAAGWQTVFRLDFDLRPIAAA